MTEIGQISALEALEKRLLDAIAGLTLATKGLALATKADNRTEADRIIEAWHAARAKP